MKSLCAAIYALQIHVPIHSVSVCCVFVTMRSLSSVYINQKFEIVMYRKKEGRRKEKNVKHTLILLTFIQPVVYSILLYMESFIYVRFQL